MSASQTPPLVGIAYLIAHQMGKDRDFAHDIVVECLEKAHKWDPSGGASWCTWVRWKAQNLGARRYRYESRQRGDALWTQWAPPNPETWAIALERTLRPCAECGGLHGRKDKRRGRALLCGSVECARKMETARERQRNQSKRAAAQREAS